MLTIILIDHLERNAAALQHLATTCDDNGLAVCIDMIAKEIADMADELHGNPLEELVPPKSGMSDEERMDKAAEKIMHIIGVFGAAKKDSAAGIARTVTKKGILYKGKSFNHPSLARMIGEEVILCQDETGFYVDLPEGIVRLTEWPPSSSE